jgi:GDP-L-fucose synthase
MAGKGVVLLTGGGGMVGKNILEHPEAKEWQFNAPRSVELNLADFKATLDYVKKLQPDFIIHAAGRVGGIQANIAHPVNFLVENMDMGRNIVMAAREAGVKKLLNLGSSCMSPRNAPNPLVETMILQGELEPTNEGYALAKIMTARLCDYIHREDQQYCYKTMIPCNLYGRHDKFDPNHSHLIPAIIHKIQQSIDAGHTPVEIWGDGTARREFMYVGDLADAVLRTLKHFDSLPMLMNVGLGYDYSINEYYKAVAEVIGFNGSFEHDCSKPVGMKQKLVSTDMQKAWDWSPSVSLRQGLQETYQYYKKQYQV